MIVAKLIGESDGHEERREFADVDRAKQWAQGAGLADFDDQLVRGEVWKDGEIVWTKSNLRTPENRQKNEKRDAYFFLSRLDITDKPVARGAQ